VSAAYIFRCGPVWAFLGGNAGLVAWWVWPSPPYTWPSSVGVALSVLGGNAGSLVGVAISASLLPPAVNAGLFWALALILAARGIYDDTGTKSAGILRPLHHWRKNYLYRYLIFLGSEPTSFYGHNSGGGNETQTGYSPRQKNEKTLFWPLIWICTVVVLMNELGRVETKRSGIEIPLTYN